MVHAHQLKQPGRSGTGGSHGWSGRSGVVEYLEGTVRESGVGHGGEGC